MMEETQYLPSLESVQTDKKNCEWFFNKYEEEVYRNQEKSIQKVQECVYA